jgi:hypothetical protein
MHLLCLLFLLIASLAAQDPIVIANYASETQRGWTFVGLTAAPEHQTGWLKADDGMFAPYVRDTGGVRVWAAVPAGGVAKLFWVDKPRESPGFTWHPVVEVNAMRLLPYWTLGDERSEPAAMRVVHATDAVLRVHLRTVFASRRVTIDCWLTATSGEPTIEMVQSAVYGDTRNDGQPQSVVLPELRMWCDGGRIVDDEWRRHGLGLATWTPGAIWYQPAVPAGTRWHRASRFILRGAIMAANEPVRLEGRPLVGLSLGWAGKWGPIGVVPTPNADMQQAVARQKSAWFGRTFGTYAQQRPECQGFASSTGENQGFGWASHHAVSTGDPWPILDLLWQVEAYGIRPTANKEPDGSPMQAILHPQARTMNQRPDLNLGLPDRLGWPGINGIAWIPAPTSVAYATEDDEHRAPVELAAAAALTRDPLVESIIDDLIQLDGTDVYVREHRVPSARSIGRTALAGAWWAWLGHREAEPILRQRLDDALTLRAASWPGRPVATIGPNDQAKYGWFIGGTTKPVYGWQPWQQVIAAGGLRAAGFALGEQRYLLAGEQLATMVLDEAYRVQAGSLKHAYAVTYNDGQPLADERWPIAGNLREIYNDHVYVIPDTDTWTVGAALIARKHPRAELVRTATPIRTGMNARWRALR